MYICSRGGSGCKVHITWLKYYLLLLLRRVRVTEGESITCHSLLRTPAVHALDCEFSSEYATDYRLVVV